MSSVHHDVARFGEGDMILDPGLPEIFGDKLLKDFSPVVLGGGEKVVEEGFGADGEGLAGLEKLLPFLVGLEAEGTSSATACMIQRADEGEQVSRSYRAPDCAGACKAEHIVVGVGKAVVLLNHGLENRGVHRGSPLFTFWDYYTIQNRTCQPLFSIF